MLLVPGDPKILHLKRGEFAIPKLEWEEDIPLVIGGDSSVLSMKTHMSNNGFAYLINKWTEELEEGINANSLLPLIEQKITNWHEQNKDSLLLEIFHLIQLWGGKEARHFYRNNCTIDLNQYHRCIVTAISQRNIKKIVDAVEQLIRVTERFNIAFATKHISLWQYYSKSKIKLPIYDSIMAKNIMGRYTLNKKLGRASGITQDRYGDLHHYWENMNITSHTLQLCTSKLERQLFNFFRNGGAGWSRVKNISKKTKHSKKILYLHGLESKLSDTKRNVLEAYGSVFAPEIDYSHSEDQSDNITATYRTQEYDVVIGSSMGGLNAFLIGTKQNIPCLCFNPPLGKYRIDFQYLRSSSIEISPCIILGGRDKVVEPSSTLLFLQNQIQTLGFQIKVNPELEHRIPLNVFKNSIESFFSDLISPPNAP